MDKTNFVFYVAILVIAMSILSMGFELTGRVADTAQVNVTIRSATAINFTTDFIDFGAGSVTPGQDNSTLQSNASGSSTNGNWTQPNEMFVLENIGNTNVSLDLASGKTAAVFIGGTDPDYEYAFFDHEANSCVNQTASGAWADVNTGGDTICNPFYSADANDEINVSIKLVIPTDSQSGALTDTFTATATAV